MTKPCGCGSKKAGKTPQYDKTIYALKNADGQTVRTFGNRSSAVRTLKKYPSYTLEPVEA